MQRKKSKVRPAASRAKLIPSRARPTHAGGAHVPLGPALLDQKLPTPLYHQIYLVLRDRIRSAAFTSSSTLPSEQELAGMFGVSRITVKRALNDLAAEGLVTRHRGRGTIVTGGAAIPVVVGSFDTLIGSLRAIGLQTEVELLDVETIKAAGDVAALLALAPGTRVQRSVRLRKLKGEPFSYLVTFVPADIARRYSELDLATKPILQLLERAGAAARSAEQWISAVAAEPHIASALRVAPSAPLLKVQRVMRGAKGKPIQLIYGHYRPDRYQYYVRGERSRSRQGSLDWTLAE